jgi:hypothetical protein
MYVPKKKSSAKKKNSIPKDRSILMRRRNRINQSLTKVRSPTNMSKLKNELVLIEKSLQSSYKKAQIYRENKAIEAIKSNPKFFFSYAKKFSKIKSNIGPLLNNQGEYTNDSRTMANLLSDQYASVFSQPVDLHENDNQHSLHNPTISEITFNESDIIKAINEISQTSAAGPDNFPSALLKNCNISLSVPLTKFWRKCIETGEIPQSLKTAIITPQHKSGSRALPANYRPIALTSHIIKIFEKIVRNSLVSFMNTNNLFNNSQHGFRTGRSCLSQLLAHFDSILKLLADGFDVDTIYLDFSKAFDKVDHNIVLSKLKKLGVRGKLLEWIKSFLMNRTQSVIINGTQSDSSKVISGVPQGSVLGPLIFLILIGDINEEILYSILRSFADDTRISKGIKSLSDTNNLQDDLNSIYNWASKNNMSFNANKFELIRYTTNTSPTNKNYISSTGSTIKEKKVIKDLGVHMSNDATFTHHIHHVVSSARHQSSWILRIFKSRATHVMKLLWKSLVLPILEYCSQIWSPYKQSDICSLEAIQWSFLRKMIGAKDKDYWECLTWANMYSLQRRRERYQIIYVWKILEGLVPDFGTQNHPAVSSYNSLRRGRVCNIPVVCTVIPKSLQTKMYGSLSHIGPRLFNVLPRPLRDHSGKSVTTFKSLLDKHLSRIPDEPSLPGYSVQRCAETNSIINFKTVHCFK